MPGSITPLGAFFTSNSLTDERMTVFLAAELEKVPNPLRADDTVEIELKILPFGQMGELIRKGEINDGSTIACVQYLFEHLRNR